MAANVFKRAKTMWKQPGNKNKSWQQMIAMASNKSQPKKTAMATAKKKPASRKKSVSGVKRTTTTSTKKSTKKRVAVGAVVDRHMLYLAAGMAAQSFVQKLVIDPIRSRASAALPGGAGVIIDPAQAWLSYMGIKKWKQPFIQGVLMGTMKQGVDGTVTLILGKINMGAKGGGNQNMGDTYELPMPNLGEIKQYLSGIGDVGNSASMPAMSGNPMGDIDPADEVIMPLGYDK